MPEKFAFLASFVLLPVKKFKKQLFSPLNARIIKTVFFKNEEIKVMKKVVKFGGSSLASAEQFQKVGSIILADESRRYVVPSAPGKRFEGDTKVTDMLYQCYYTAANGEDFTGMLRQIKARYNEIIDRKSVV